MTTDGAVVEETIGFVGLGVMGAAMARNTRSRSSACSPAAWRAAGCSTSAAPAWSPTASRRRFRTELHHKDLGIALETARAAGISLPVTALVDQMMASLRQNGHGASDHSALLAYIERASNHTVGSQG